MKKVVLSLFVAMAIAVSSDVVAQKGAVVEISSVKDSAHIEMGEDFEISVTKRDNSSSDSDGGLPIGAIIAAVVVCGGAGAYFAMKKKKS